MLKTFSCKYNSLVLYIFLSIFLSSCQENKPDTPVKKQTLEISLQNLIIEKWIGWQGKIDNSTTLELKVRNISDKPFFFTGKKHLIPDSIGLITKRDINYLKYVDLTISDTLLPNESLSLNYQLKVYDLEKSLKEIHESIQSEFSDKYYLYSPNFISDTLIIEMKIDSLKPIFYLNSEQVNYDDNLKLNEKQKSMPDEWQEKLFSP